VLGHAVQPRRVHVYYPHAALRRDLREIACAAVAARLVDVDLFHARGVLPQPAGNGVEAVDETRLCHSAPTPRVEQG
jgi:hypothetical protein